MKTNLCPACMNTANTINELGDEIWCLRHKDYRIELCELHQDKNIFEEKSKALKFTEEEFNRLLTEPDWNEEVKAGLIQR